MICGAAMCSAGTRTWRTKKLSVWIAALVIVIIFFASVGFWVIASGTAEETWKSIGYPSAFLLGLIGAASVIIPVPTTVVLLGMAMSRLFNQTLLALALGFGAAIGQLTSYVVGYAGRVEFEGKKRGFKKGAAIPIAPGMSHTIIATENTIIHEVSTPHPEDVVRVKDFYAVR